MIEVIFDENFLILSVGDAKINVDLYYYRIDPNLYSDDESITKALKVFKRKILNWKFELKNLSIKNNHFFIPVEFHDEYIGLLGCEYLENEMLLIKYGFTTDIEGYSIYPSSKEIKRNFIFEAGDDNSILRISRAKLEENLSNLVTSLELKIAKAN